MRNTGLVVSVIKFGAVNDDDVRTRRLQLAVDIVEQRPLDEAFAAELSLVVLDARGWGRDGQDVGRRFDLLRRLGQHAEVRIGDRLRRHCRCAKPDHAADGDVVLNALTINLRQQG